MRVRRRRYGNHVRTGALNRFVEIGECLRYTAALGTPPSAFGIRTYEAHDFEACGSQCRNVNSATEACVNNQRRRLRSVHAIHDHPACSVAERTVYAPFESASR